jgi:hypothetical protein
LLSAIARRHAPPRLAPVVEGGDLRRRLPPARKSFVEKPNRRAILVRGQDLEAGALIAKRLGIPK